MENELQRLWPHTGAILAGGLSRRMGTPKEGVPLWDGRPMIEHVLSALTAVCRRIVVVGDSKGFIIPPDRSIIQIPDRHPGGGPLAGIESLLASGLDKAYLVVACDQPLITPDILRRLVAGDPLLPTFYHTDEGERLDPFPGYFPVGWLPYVQEALDRDTLSVRDLIGRVNVSWITIPPVEEPRLKSVNTPGDLQETQLLARRGLDARSY